MTSPLWAEAALAGTLLALDPAGLKGAVLRAGPGPVREVWLAQFRALAPPDAPWRRLPSAIADERLLGGLDLAASLAAGKPVAQAGLLAEADGGVLLAPMAERLEPGTAARLAACLDTGRIRAAREGFAFERPARFALLALDESECEEAGPPAALAERLAFQLDLSGLSHREAQAWPTAPATMAPARARLARLPPLAPEQVQALAGAGAAMGVSGLFPLLAAARAALAHAALAGREAAQPEDIAVAARLVLAPRALLLPEPAEAPPEPPPPSEQEAPPPAPERPPEELVLEAVRAALPEGLLAALVAANARRGAARQRGEGLRRSHPLRGRPAGVRSGQLAGGARLALMDTLRAAAPWQRLRRARPGAAIAVRPEDFRLKRFTEREGATTIFVVDASGSAALQRLNEAKGAVELLLAKAYASRAQAALIAFRGQGAELLLPPTRSLARARRLLADLPGGGGTPLAAAIEAAGALAAAERAKGRTPQLVFLTDGKANIARDGAAGRALAEADAEAAARRFKALGLKAAFVDTGPRPRPENARLAAALGAHYAPLPYLEAAALAASLEKLA